MVGTHLQIPPLVLQQLEVIKHAQEGGIQEINATHREECDKRTKIILPHAVSDPGTVVVEVLHTSLAVVAVFGLQIFFYLAEGTYIVAVHTLVQFRYVLALVLLDKAGVLLVD